MTSKKTKRTLDMLAEVSRSKQSGVAPRQSPRKILASGAESRKEVFDVLISVLEEELNKDQPQPAAAPAATGDVEVAEKKTPKEKKMGKADMRSLQKQPELPLETLKKLPGKTLRELLSTPTSDEYSRKIEITCGFYPDGRCKETFKAFNRDDQVHQLVEKHLKIHISDEEKRGQLFSTSSVQFRSKKVKDSNSKKGKEPKASLKNKASDKNVTSNKKQASQKRKKTSKDTCPEEEPPVKKTKKSPSVSSQESEEKENEAQEEVQVTEEEVGVAVPHSDHTYAALPGTKPRQEDPVSPTTSESGSFASEISGISMDTRNPAEEDSQSVLGGHPYAAQEETVSDGASDKKCEAEGERVAYPTLTRKRVTEPKSPEEVSRAKQLLDELKIKKKDPNFKIECEMCPGRKPFTAAASLVNHIKSQHAGMKNFPCTMPGCTASFTRKYSLKYHLDTHKGEYRFTCEHCKKKCRHKSHFQEHLRRHTGESPFVCSHCPNSYKTRNTYKRHLKTCHAILLTRDGETKMSDEEFAKVRTKAYKKSESLPQAQEQASPSTSGGSSPKSLKAEPESPTSSVPPIALPPVGTFLPGPSSMNPQPSMGILPPAIQRAFSQAAVLQLNNILYPAFPNNQQVPLIQPVTMTGVPFSADQSGVKLTMTTPQLVYTISECGHVMNMEGSATASSSQPLAPTPLSTSLSFVPSAKPLERISQPLVPASSSVLQPLVPNTQSLVPISQPSGSILQSLVPNTQSMVPVSQSLGTVSYPLVQVSQFAQPISQPAVPISQSSMPSTQLPVPNT